MWARAVLAALICIVPKLVEAHSLGLQPWNSTDEAATRGVITISQGRPVVAVAKSSEAGNAEPVRVTNLSPHIERQIRRLESLEFVPFKIAILRSFHASRGPNDIVAEE